MHAMKALKKKILQKRTLPSKFGGFKGVGISFLSDANRFRFKKNLEIGINIMRAKIIFISVRISFQCQI